MRKVCFIFFCFLRHALRVRYGPMRAQNAPFRATMFRAFWDLSDVLTNFGVILPTTEFFFRGGRKYRTVKPEI